MNIALFSPPPVGLISADDVIEGFPLDLCVLSRALQGIICLFWTKPLKPWSNCYIYVERKGISNW